MILMHKDLTMVLYFEKKNIVYTQNFCLSFSFNVPQFSSHTACPVAYGSLNLLVNRWDKKEWERVWKEALIASLYTKCM